MNRRDFIRQVSIGALAVLAGAWLHRHAVPSDPEWTDLSGLLVSDNKGNRWIPEHVGRGETVTFTARFSQTDYGRVELTLKPARHDH